MFVFSSCELPTSRKSSKMVSFVAMLDGGKINKSCNFSIFEACVDLNKYDDYMHFGCISNIYFYVDNLYSDLPLVRTRPLIDRV